MLIVWVVSAQKEFSFLLEMLMVIKRFEAPLKTSIGCEFLKKLSTNSESMQEQGSENRGGILVLLCKCI